MSAPAAQEQIPATEASQAAPPASASHIVFGRIDVSSSGSSYTESSEDTRRRRGPTKRDIAKMLKMKIDPNGIDFSESDKTPESSQSGNSSDHRWAMKMQTGAASGAGNSRLAAALRATTLAPTARPQGGRGPGGGGATALDEAAVADVDLISEDDGSDADADKNGQATTGKGKLRPCKGKRDRYKRLIGRLLMAVEQDPDGFSFDSVELPPSIAANEATRAKLAAKVKLYAEQVKAQRPGGSAGTSGSGRPAPGQAKAAPQIHQPGPIRPAGSRPTGTTSSATGNEGASTIISL